MTISTRKRKRNKSVGAPAFEIKEAFEAIEITDPKLLPVRYLVVSENWPECIDKKREKLLKRGLRIVTPIKVYKLTRIIEMTDLCLELEPV